MGMSAVQVATDELRGLAGQLPHGRVFSSGRAFVPFVKGSLYDQLATHAPKPDPKANPKRNPHPNRQAAVRFRPRSRSRRRLPPMPTKSPPPGGRRHRSPATGTQSRSAAWSSPTKAMTTAGGSPASARSRAMACSCSSGATSPTCRRCYASAPTWRSCTRSARSERHDRYHRRWPRGGQQQANRRRTARIRALNDALRNSFEGGNVGRVDEFEQA